MQLIAKSFLILFLSILVVQCSSIQSNYPVERSNEDGLSGLEEETLGACYAKCLKESETSTETIWTQVLCEEDMSQELLQEVLFSLADKGYNVGLIFNENSKEALREFQYEKNLPQCLNLETLDSLNIDITELNIPRLNWEKR